MMLRSAVVLGLQEGMQQLSEDDIPVYDDVREPWGEEGSFVSSDGVEVLVELHDAQHQFNLNDLSLPVSQSTYRTPEQMLEELIRRQEIPDATEKAARITAVVNAKAAPLQHPRELLSSFQEDETWVRTLIPFFTALPRPERRPLKLNLNAVQPEVLFAVTGPQASGWVSNILSQRETAPIPSVSAALAGLPPIAKDALTQVVDVRSEFFWIRVTGEVDRMQKSVEALVMRSTGGAVEIMRCQW